MTVLAHVAGLWLALAPPACPAWSRAVAMARMCEWQHGAAPGWRIERPACDAVKAAWKAVQECP